MDKFLNLGKAKTVACPSGFIPGEESKSKNSVWLRFFFILEKDLNEMSHEKFRCKFCSANGCEGKYNTTNMRKHLSVHHDSVAFPEVVEQLKKYSASKAEIADAKEEKEVVLHIIFSVFPFISFVRTGPHSGSSRVPIRFEA
jgi:hypothetical protein